MGTPFPQKGTPDHAQITSNGEQPPEVPVNKLEGKPNQSLNVILPGGTRAPSPTPSIISIDDFNNVRLGRDPDYLRFSHETRQTSPSPAPPPRSLRGRLTFFWTANKGLFLVMIAQLFGTLMNVTTRLLEIEGNHGKGYHPFQILYARMGITVILATIYMWKTKTEHFPLGMKEVRPLLVARGLLGFFGVFGMYYSLQYLPLADATVITFLAPSLACWACSFLINEPFTKMEQIAAYVSLFGVVLIARPVSFFSSEVQSGEHDKVTPAQRAAAVGVALLGVVGAAGAYTTIRWIGRRCHPLISVNYFATWCTIVSIFMMAVLPDVNFMLPATLKDWCYLIFLGVCGFVMQFLLAAGLQQEKSSRATNMVYTQMLFALTFDKLVFGTTPNWLSIVGSSLILGSAIYVALHKEAPVKEPERSTHASREEEVGLMSPTSESDTDMEDGTDVQLRRMRL